MICPRCKVSFRGGSFHRQGERGKMRECPNGHEFKEPVKPRRHCRTCTCLEVNRSGQP